MKKERITLPLLTMAIALLATGLAHSFQQEYKSVKADYTSPLQLYVELPSIDYLKEGDTVIFGSTTGYVMTSLAGNPVFTTGEHINTSNSNYTKYLFETSDAIPFQVGITNDNFYTFKSINDSNKEKNYAHPTNGRYLAYGTSYSDSNYHNIGTLGDINTSTVIDEHSKWDVAINTETHYATLQYSTEAYKDSGISIRWDYRSNGMRCNFGYYLDSYNYSPVKIYKKIDTTQTFNISISQEQNQSSVVEGTQLDLSGFEMELIAEDGMTFTSVYNEEPSYYDVAAAVNPSTGVVYFYYAGNIYYRTFADIIEARDTYSYFNEITTPLNDYRGTYVIGMQFKNDVDEEQSYVEILINKDKSDYLPISDESSASGTYYKEHILRSDNNATSMNRYEIVRTSLTEGGTRLQFLQSVYDGKYLINDNGSFSLVEKTALTKNNVVVIDENLNIKLGNSYIGYSDGDFHLGTGARARLFKIIYDQSEELDTFVSNFNTYTSANCDSTGNTNTTITSEGWSNLAEEFYGLEADDQGYLANMSYVHNNETSGSIKDIIDRYDYIVSKYPSLTNDFMDRIAANTLRENVSTSEIKLINLFNKDNTDMIVAIIVVLSALSIATLLFVVKRKKHLERL